MSRFRATWWAVASSLWFLPAAGVCVALLLAMALIEFDAASDSSLGRAWPRLFGAGADAAREMLTAIASSTITVAGVIFSVTIVALSLASSQYSPRVLRTFTTDRPTQVVLGVFVGIYVYCLVVLRTVRGSNGTEFVPSVAVLGGLVLALVGIGFLVFFIHHLAQSVQASSIVARITAATLATVDQLFPNELNSAERHPAGENIAPDTPWSAVPATRTGYVIHVSTTGLVASARRHDRTVRMHAGVGDFVIEGQVLAMVSGGSIAPALQKEINGAYTVDSQRTITQDAVYGVQQLVDIARKALSPAMNDASTAILCVDRLTEILVRLARRNIESPLHRDNGAVRVIARGTSFEDLVHVAYAPLYQDAREQHGVMMRLLWSVEQVAAATQDAQRRAVLQREVRCLMMHAERSGALEMERDAVLRRARQLLH